MTDRTNDNESTSEIPGRPEGQDTSETMTDKTSQETETTKVLPPAETPPTQEIAQATQRIPVGPAPEGEVHPAYGAAAARVEAEAAAPAVHDAPADQAPADDDNDPLAPLRDPAPEVQATPAATVPESGAPVAGPASGTDVGLTQPVPPVRPAPAAQPTTPVQTAPVQTAPVQTAQPAAPAPEKRRARVGTAVWGLIVLAVGLGILAVSAGVIFDLGVALIVVLGAAGVILVVGSVVSSLRRR